MHLATKEHRLLTSVACVLTSGLVAGCSTSSSGQAPSNDGRDGTVDAGKDCSTIAGQRPFDDAHSCFDDPPIDVTGVCREQASGTPTTGLEPVCAVHRGQLFVLLVGTDQILSGDGWTFGPRASPDVVHEPSTLSAADESRCADAHGTPINRTCASDAGSDGESD